MLRGHVALVTGAGSGIGRATCELFAKEDAAVVAVDINLKDAADTVKLLLGKNHLCLNADVTKKNEIETAIAEIKSKYSTPPTITVNSAGVYLAGSFLDVTEESFYRLVDVNIKGLMLTTQLVCKELIAAGKKGSIINMASMAAVTCSPAHTLYSTTKAAVDCFSKAAAKEMVKYNIRINSVLPGMTNTPMMKSVTKEYITKYVPKSMIDNQAQPNDIAQVVLFLASDSSSFVSGSSYTVCGGLI